MEEDELVAIDEKYHPKVDVFHFINFVSPKPQLFKVVGMCESCFLFLFVVVVVKN